MACNEGQFNVVELIIQRFWYQFECATCEWKDSLLSKRSKNTPFRMACKKGQFDVVELIIAQFKDF